MKRIHTEFQKTEQILFNKTALSRRNGFRFWNRQQTSIIDVGHCDQSVSFVQPMKEYDARKLHRVRQVIKNK